MMKQSRRDFIKTTSAATAGVAFSPEIFAQNSASNTNAYPIGVFTKCLQFLDYAKLGETLSAIGFKNAELSVREGGHVLPKNIKTDLPRAIKVLQQSGVKVPMMVTEIINPDLSETEMVLGTAAECGIKYYRMGYLSYDPAKSVMGNLEVHQKSFGKLEKMNSKFGLHGTYQNHSGTRVGGPVWDLYSLVKDCDPAFMGVQYDIRHAVCEGGASWPLGMRLLSPWIKTNAIKDFIWKKVGDKWKITNRPLGEGMVDFDAFIKEYIALGIAGPVTIHYEYDLGGAQSGIGTPTMSVEEISGFMKKDLNWLKKKFEENGILGSFE